MEEIISYPVFKGLQKPLEFMGIRGKFIYYAAGTFLFGFIGFLVFNIILGFGGFHKQVQSYTIFVLIISFGFINPFFFLGLLFNFSIIFLM